MGNEQPNFGEEIPSDLQPVVELWFTRAAERGVQVPAELHSALARLLACSEFAGKVLLRDFAWFRENPGAFSDSDNRESLQGFVDSVGAADIDDETMQSRLRQFRNRDMLRILWREVQGKASLDDTMLQLSRLADRLLDAAMRHAAKQLTAKYGEVRDKRGELVPLVVLGMGKLGGNELNFSSDIDIIFCFSENGESDGARSISAQEYFTRYARRVISLLDEITVDGFVFRVDTRLRPFGDSGPPVVSFAAMESYLTQHGRDWERYAYVKARIVGTPPPDAVATDLQQNIVRPFVFRRYLDYGVFESVREMQAMIATEVRRRELADNVKLGPGGIREIEFIVQALQLVRGGSEPELQRRKLLTVLPLLANERGIRPGDAEALGEAYRFLRRLENFIQAIRDEQTHDLPDDTLDRSRLCLAMDIPSWDELTAILGRHRDAVTRQFSEVAVRGKSDNNYAAPQFAQLWESDADEQRWADALREAGCDDAGELARLIAEFTASTAVQHIDSVSEDRLQRFFPNLITRIVASENPVAALSRTLAVTDSILRRSAYLALLNENQQAMARLVELCAESQYVANQVALFPALLDELLDPYIYANGVTRAELARELQDRFDGADELDSEARMQVIAEFQRAAMFRIAVADCSGKLPIMKVSDGLTWLAEVVLDEALAVAWQDLVSRHGKPTCVVDGVRRDAGFGIIGYGKLGGLELSYGSDLDIVFLHDSAGEQQQTAGEKTLDNTMFFSRLVGRLVHFLTVQTGSGELYEVDTRLRPDGRSGLLVSNTAAFERYQVENAWTWEHQALLRARPVAGSAEIAAQFERIRADTLTKRVRREQLRDDVSAMRVRMRKQLDRSDAEFMDIKHGSGGIGDIEFLVQYLVLLEAKAHPALLEYSDNIRQLDALVAATILETSVGEGLQDAYRTYRLAQHRLVLDGHKALCPVDQFVTERQLVESVWQQWLD